MKRRLFLGLTATAPIITSVTPSKAIVKSNSEYRCIGFFVKPEDFEGTTPKICNLFSNTIQNILEEPLDFKIPIAVEFYKEQPNGTYTWWLSNGGDALTIDAKTICNPHLPNGDLILLAMILRLNQQSRLVAQQWKGDWGQWIQERKRLKKQIELVTISYYIKSPTLS